MNSKLLKIFGALVAAGTMFGANAASILLVPTGQTTDLLPGDTVTFDVMMDFTTDNNGLGSDITLGGGFDIIYDPTALQFVGLISDNLGDPAFGRDPDDCSVVSCDSGAGAGVLESWGFADFNGLTGPARVGQVSFAVLAGGPMSSFVSTGPTQGIAGPFVSGVDFITILNVDYNSVEVTQSVIPLPAAVWFMLSGLGVLLGIRRKTA